MVCLSWLYDTAGDKNSYLQVSFLCWMHSVASLPPNTEERKTQKGYWKCLLLFGPMCFEWLFLFHSIGCTQDNILRYCRNALLIPIPVSPLVHFLLSFAVVWSWASSGKRVMEHLEKAYPKRLPIPLRSSSLQCRGVEESVPLCVFQGCVGTLRCPWQSLFAVHLLLPWVSLVDEGPHSQLSFLFCLKAVATAARPARTCWIAQFSRTVGGLSSKIVVSWEWSTQHEEEPESKW